jgi:adenosine deaminase
MRSLKSLPKAHLHLHTEGSARPETIYKLAKRKKIDLGNLWDFTDFQSCLRAYDSAVSVITEPGDLTLIIHDYVKHEAEQGVIYIEPSIAPQFYTDIFHLSLDEVFYIFFTAYRDATKANNIEFGLIPTVILKNDDKTIESIVCMAIDHRQDGVVSFGIAGEEEAGINPSRMERFCKIAHEGGLQIVPHAGEFEGPKSVWGAVQILHADRLAHGIRAVENPTLMAYLSSNHIVCDVAISSNVRINIYQNIIEHPVATLIRSGVPVTLNADDELLIKSSISNEYEIARNYMGLSDFDIAEIARTSIKAATLSEVRTEKALIDIDNWLSCP